MSRYSDNDEDMEVKWNRPLYIKNNRRDFISGKLEKSYCKV